MRTLRFGQFKQVRVWLGELPDARYIARETITRNISASGASTPVRTQAAVELYVPAGPRWSYGLLGGEWHADATDNSCRVSLSIAGANARPFADALATGDRVLTGLPLEYANAVSTGLDMMFKRLTAVPRGTLAVACAAHGEIGSSDAVYRHLAAMLVTLIHASPAEPSDEELIQLFPTTFN